MNQLHYFLVCFITLLSCNSGNNKKENVSNVTPGSIKIQLEKEKISDFLKSAHSNSIMIIKSSEIADEKVKNSDIKLLRSTLVQEHFKLKDEIEAVAINNDINLPKNLKDDHQEKVNNLQRVEEEFDWIYLDMMVDEHSKILRNYQSAKKNAKGEDLIYWLEEKRKKVDELLKKSSEIAMEIEKKD